MLLDTYTKRTIIKEKELRKKCISDLYRLCGFSNMDEKEFKSILEKIIGCKSKKTEAILTDLFFCSLIRNGLTYDDLYNTKYLLRFCNPKFRSRHLVERVKFLKEIMEENI